MKKIALVCIALVSTFFIASTARAADAGFTLAFGEYSVFVRSDGTTEIRVKGNITDKTSTTLNCAVGSGRDILAVGNQINPGGSTPTFNSATLATVLTAYATQNALEVLISDEAKDLNNNCGVLLVHLRCEGCPSGL